MARFSEYRLGRQLALQFLFSLEFSDLNWSLALPEFWRMEPVVLSEESLDPDEAFAVPGDRVRPVQVAGARVFAEPLIQGVCEEQAVLDEMIAGALDNWRPERVGRIEWVILRLALYEMTHCPESPDTVVISEAIRLATLFGDEESPRFVNGLLNRFLEQKNQGDERPSDTEGGGSG